MKKLVKLILILLGIAALIGLGYLVYTHYQFDFVLRFQTPHLNRAKWIARIRNHGFEDALLFSAMIAILSAIPGLPISVVAVFVGVGFGPWLGLLINLIGITVGNLFDIGLLKRFGFSKNNQRSQRFVDALSKRKHPLVGIALGYMIPVIPTILVDITAVKMKISFRQIVPTVIAGALPVSFLYAFGGDALLRQNPKRLTGAIIGLLIVIGLVALLRKDFQKHEAKKMPS
ncbi:hypothetical protein IV38_GL001667 [Lactobacillus selangorensis]|uniref:VTT domain-containing protein n=1 Tax=Lactobacillus selangorensis TaxID=81857 RepID=A0A0R2FPC5_9LACO|nr:VTT domain-containing protein [Lactobacillus selangorensis]KRN28213.1 hypothetical protein IV38_GL001667 [Lactobacillus selangorensis]KRN30911.1 hypothetical protein IV40_GL001548 [Lactobacillus selangorensis]